MAAARHNLSRRALLGAGVGACASIASDTPLLAAQFAAPPPASGADRHMAVPALRDRWDRALADYRRAKARVAAFKAAEAQLPAERRAYPCEDLEEAFGRLDGIRLRAVRRLLLMQAPDLEALSLKLGLAVADQAWELAGCETCLVLLSADARRLADDA